MNFSYMFESRSFRIKLLAFSLFNWLNPDEDQVVKTLMEHPLVTGRESWDHQLPSHCEQFVKLKAAELIALGMFIDGEKLNYSSDLAEFITIGYGKLDPYGEWEYPLPVQLVHQIEFLLSTSEI